MKSLALSVFLVSLLFTQDVVLQEHSGKMEDFPFNSLNLVSLPGISERYFFSPTGDGGSFYEALSFCNIYGMKLVKLDSSYENDVVKEYIKNIQGLPATEGFYTGLHKIQRTQWLWPDGSVLNHTDWYSSEPNSNNYDCMVISGYYNGWLDQSCDGKKLFICETP